MKWKHVLVTVCIVSMISRFFYEKDGEQLELRIAEWVLLTGYAIIESIEELLKKMYEQNKKVGTEEER